MQLRLLFGRPACIAAKYEEKQGAIIAQRETANHAARPIVHEIHILIASAIEAGFECRDAIAEMSFEHPDRPEREAPHLRMQAVSADDEIETSPPAAPQLDVDPFRLRLQGNDLLVEDRFNAIADRPVQQAR